MSRTRKYLAASIAIATFLVYLSALGNSFIEIDDDVYIVDNPNIRSLTIRFFRWAFLNFYAANWHPLTWVSHALDYAVWGMNPLGHHLTSIILHAVNTCAVVFLIFRLLDLSKEETARGGRAPSFDQQGILIAAGTTGFLFGLHPIHVESVAWVAERKDLLCGLFFLLSIFTYTNYVVNVTKDGAQKNLLLRLFNKHYLSTAGFFILALLSKPMAVTLPAVLLILDWYPFNRIRSLNTLRPALLEKIPFAALSLIASFLTVAAQKAGGAVASIETVSVSARILVPAKSLIAYLCKMAFPYHLVPFYSYPSPGEISLFHPEYALAIALVIGITITCLAVMKKQKLWFSAWCYYVITLTPVIGILQVGGQAMADRYTYLPSLGPFLIVGIATARFFSSVSTGKRGRTVRVIGITMAFSVFVFLSYLTFKQIGVWKNSFVVLDYILAKEPQSDPRVNLNRGVAFSKTGKFDKAIEDYNRAIALNPSYYQAFFYRGMAFENMGEFHKAVDDYNKAIRLNPSDYQAYTNRGALYQKIGQDDKAVEDLRKAIALMPSSEKAHFNLGAIYARTGLLDKAIEAFNQAVAIDPGYADAYCNRGIAYSLIGRQDRALEDFNKAVELGQNIPMVYVNRGNFYFKKGNIELAISDFQKSCLLGDADSCRTLTELRTKDRHQ